MGEWRDEGEEEVAPEKQHQSLQLLPRAWTQAVSHSLSARWHKLREEFDELLFGIIKLEVWIAWLNLKYEYDECKKCESRRLVWSSPKTFRANDTNVNLQQLIWPISAKKLSLLVALIDLISIQAALRDLLSLCMVIECCSRAINNFNRIKHDSVRWVFVLRRTLCASQWNLMVASTK